MALIFDLDQTIVDSSRTESLRKKGDWTTVYTHIPYFKLYDGMLEVLDFVNQKKLKICIVTSSPSTYCKRVLEHWKIPYHQKVCYHDTSKRKPHPDPITRGLQLIECVDLNHALSFGDRAIDIQASRAAGVRSVGCLWGSAEDAMLRQEKPDFLAESPKDLIPIIKSHYGIG